MRTFRLRRCLAFVVAMLAGCASVPMQGYLPDGRFCFRVSKHRVCTAEPVPSVEQEAKAKQFRAAPGFLTIWVVRSTRFDDYGRVPLAVGGHKVETLPHTVSRFTVRHGQHSIQLRNSSDLDAILVEGNAGEQVFAEVVANVGFFTTCFSLRRIAEEEGRQKVLASKLIRDVNKISPP